LRLFTLTLPLTAIGFWNAVIGLIIMRTSADPATTLCPPLADANDQHPIRSRTALLSCIRNEDPQPSAQPGPDDRRPGRCRAGEHFERSMLSDSDWPEVIAAEEARAAELAARWHGACS
jgi:membrane glycosyltransferase